MQEFNMWFYRNQANGKDFIANSEYYGFSVKMNGKTIKYNHQWKKI